jgi:repressor of nif and glnA expression
MDMDRILREQARLIILRALSAEIDETLNSDLIVQHLRPFGIRRDRAWVHDELAWLREMGAIAIVAAGSVQVARLTEKGHRHLQREIAIEGIQRPSRPGG